MTTDNLSAALDEIRERYAKIDEPCGDLACVAGRLKHSTDDVPRLLAALDKALKLHQPRQLYGMVESCRGESLCAHDPDYDGDAHFEGDDGLWYCKDKPTVKVCGLCSDGADGDMWAAWPCPTYEGISRGLLGKDGSDGQ